MSVTLADLKLYYAQVDPDDDVVSPIGGPIDRTKRPAFIDAAGLMQIVSSTAVDTTQQVNVFGRDVTGLIVNELKTLAGVTPQVLSTTFERLLKSIKTGLTVGDIAVEAQTGQLSGVLAGATLFDVTLPAGFSAVDGAFNQWVLRETGTNKAIRRIINYIGLSKTATLDHPFTTLFPAAAVAGDNRGGTGESFVLSKGFFFDRNPSEVIEVRRPFYNASADTPGGSTKKYYAKMFWDNTSPQMLSLLAAAVAEVADPNADIAFALGTAFNDMVFNAGNRQTAPVSGVTAFDSATKNVPGGTGDLKAGSTIAMWAELTLLAGAAAQNSTWTPRLTGQTV
jgi:hypothetical protein